MRLRLLCEDRKTENLVRRTCQAWGVDWPRDVRVELAPEARGAASAWVLARFAGAVRRLRAQANHQPDLALLVVVDGDNVGGARRKTAADEALAADGQARRGERERVVIWVPTWSVETWRVFRLEAAAVDEATSYRNDPRVASERVEVEEGAWLARVLRDVQPAGLPSLEDARRETRQRLPA